MIIDNPSNKPVDASSARDGGRARSDDDGRISRGLISQVSRIRLDSKTGAFKPFPELRSQGQLQHWINTIETTLKDGGVPLSEWSDAAILFLDKDGDVNRAMRTLRDSRIQQGDGTWPWEEFTAALLAFLVEHDARPSAFQSFRNDHPIATTVAGSLMIAAVSPPLFVGALNVIGFGSGGVAAGSVAAGAQSIFYGGATSGLFGACQSAGAAGLGAAATTLTSAIGGVAGYGLLGRRKSKEDQGDNSISQTPQESLPLSLSPPPPPPPYNA